MARIRPAVAALLALSLLAVGGCAPRVAQGRLYNLATAERIDMTLTFSGERNGLAKAVFPNGAELEGEFVLWAERPGLTTEGKWGRIRSLFRGQSGGSTEWSEVYGAGEGSTIEPVGSAVLLGEDGTMIDMVFYHAKIYHGVTGDGLAKDHLGRWYRVLIGPLP